VSRRVVRPFNHAIDTKRDLIGDDVEIGLVPVAEPHGIANLGRNDAHETVTDRERDGEHALRVLQTGHRNLRFEGAFTGRRFAADRPAVAKIGLEARQPNQAALACMLQAIALVSMSVGHYV
jgi:hypothetical protein